MSQHQSEQHGHARAKAHEATDELRLTQPASSPEVADTSFEDLLDQIDAVIERNPEGYVRSFVQRGGQ